MDVFLCVCVCQERNVSTKIIVEYKWVKYINSDY